MKTTLKYIGQHQNKDNYDVDTRKVDDLLQTGNYILIDSAESSIIKEIIKEQGEPKKVRPKRFPKEYWSEDEIHEWVLLHNPELEYSPENHTKKYILERIKEAYK